MSKLTAPGNERACNEALKNLRAIIREEFPEGGFLPNQLKMCERLGVSSKTYDKAIKYLIADSSVTTFKGRLGTYVNPLYAKVSKIGIVLSNGKESPFLENGRILAEFIATLESQCYCSQLLQATSPNKISEKILQHGTQATVWFNPADSVLPTLRHFVRDLDLPILSIINANPLVAKKAAALGLPAVSFRTAQRYSLLVDELQRHNITKILYVGEREQFEIQEGFGILKNAGFSLTDDAFIEHRQVPQNLLKTIKSTQAQCIYATGGGRVYRPLLELLDTLPALKRPLVYADYDNRHWQSGATKTKIEGFLDQDMLEIGKAAANCFLDYMKNKQSFQSRVLDYRCFLR